MTMRLIACLVLCLSMLAVAPPSMAAEADGAHGAAAHLFGYVPKPGQRARFDAGYRAHLQWHRDRGDPLAWYGWDVTSGERAGMFIDGSFGAPFAAFDRRVDPAGDAADGARHVTAFADPAWRASYRLRREFSTGLPLEERQPGAEMQVFHYRLKPGASVRFETLLRTARDVLRRQPDAPAYTWYEQVVGDRAPGYLLMVTRAGWAGYGAHPGGLEAVLAAAGDARSAGWLDELAASVMSVESESWRYREDLSYFPPP